MEDGTIYQVTGYTILDENIAIRVLKSCHMLSLPGRSDQREKRQFISACEFGG